MTTAYPIHENQPLPSVILVNNDFFNADPVIVTSENYCGPISICTTILLIFLFWPAALFVAFCPCDVREVVTQASPANVFVVQP
jgi:hypothetical protein